MSTIMKKKYRTFIDCHGNWTDPLIDYKVSITYHHDNNAFEHGQETGMITEIKKSKYKFKEEGLSEKTKEKFKNDKDLECKIEGKEKKTKSVKAQRPS